MERTCSEDEAVVDEELPEFILAELDDLDWDGGLGVPEDEASFCAASEEVLLVVGVAGEDCALVGFLEGSRG